MARDVLGIGTKRVVILLALMAAVMSLASSLSRRHQDRLRQQPALPGVRGSGRRPARHLRHGCERGPAERLTFDSGTKNPTSNLLSESRNPAWSPDGTQIAYESTRSGNSEIWVMNAEGTGEPVNVSQHGSWDSDPAWSPDGTQITFMSRRAGRHLGGRRAGTLSDARRGPAAHVAERRYGVGSL
jgi:hypothetical protein